MALAWADGCRNWKVQGEQLTGANPCTNLVAVDATARAKFERDPHTKEAFLAPIRDAHRAREFKRTVAPPFESILNRWGQMNSHTQACNDAKLSVKAYQNLVGSLQGFDRLLSLLPTKDHILLSSVFCFAVVKYAKPFVETMTSYGKARYPVRHLKSDPAFDFLVHKHLIDLRNTLVAHDDLESIDPRILQMCMAVESAAFIIPVSIGLSNKCLAYPIASEDIIKLKLHVAACVKGVLNKLHDDIARIRDVTLSHPELAVESGRYRKNYGQGQIGGEGTHLKPPEFMGDEWLSNATPDFSHVHKGLLYEELRVRRDFYGPERIKLPDGRELQISPSQYDGPKD